MFLCWRLVQSVVSRGMQKSESSVDSGSLFVGIRDVCVCAIYIRRFPIGKEELIKGWNTKDILEFHRKHYRPVSLDFVLPDFSHGI